MDIEHGQQQAVERRAYLICSPDPRFGQNHLVVCSYNVDFKTIVTHFRFREMTVSAIGSSSATAQRRQKDLRN